MDRYFRGKVMRHCPCKSEAEACQFFWNGTDTIDRYHNPWSSYYRPLRSTGRTWQKVADRCARHRATSAASAAYATEPQEEEEEEEAPLPSPPPAVEEPSTRAYDSAITKLLQRMDTRAAEMHADTSTSPEHQKDWRRPFDDELSSILRVASRQHMPALMERYRDAYNDRMDNIEHEMELHQERLPLAQVRDRFEQLISYVFPRATSLDAFEERLRRTEDESERVLRQVERNISPENMDTAEAIMREIRDLRNQANRGVADLRKHETTLRAEDEAKRQERARKRSEKKRYEEEPKKRKKK